MKLLKRTIDTDDFFNLIKRHPFSFTVEKISLWPDESVNYQFHWNIDELIEGHMHITVKDYKIESGSGITAGDQNTSVIPADRDAPILASSIYLYKCDKLQSLLIRVMAGIGVDCSHGIYAKD